MSLLTGKRILVTGVLTDASLAFGVARLAQEEGAEILLTGAGRGLSLTQRTARKLHDAVDVLELDVTDAAHVAAVRDAIGERWGTVDGALHAIGFAPASCLGGGFLEMLFRPRGDQRQDCASHRRERHTMINGAYLHGGLWHTVDNRAGLVLGKRAAALLAKQAQPLGAVVAHPGQHHPDGMAAVAVGGGSQQPIRAWAKAIPRVGGGQLGAPPAPTTRWQASGAT